GVYSIEEAFYLFWEEGSKYDIGTNNCTHSNTCGHYKVLTTDHSSKIGCALNICNSFTISKYPVPATFLMCSYDGMFLSDDRPYTVGVQCAGCTSSRLGYFFQYCRNRICIGPNLRFLNLGFNGSTLVIGFDYNDIIVHQE
ncbi:mucin-5AC, partial [Biomphalaria glabrata]